ncbi:MAG: hypothetical protein JSR56_12695 [Proteobacteria bacterium]|nr:hypothetical protein [Pseudomonadota bacterium]
MNITLLKASIAVASMLVAFAGPALAQGQPAKTGKVCSTATLRGGYGYTSTGTLLPAYFPPSLTFLAGPFAEVGRQTFDGMGNTNAVASLSTNGNINQDVSIYGTYVVNQDCTGSMTLQIPSLQTTVHMDFVIDQHGTGIRALSTDANVVESRDYRKQFNDDR